MTRKKIVAKIVRGVHRVLICVDFVWISIKENRVRKQYPILCIVSHFKSNISSILDPELCHERQFLLHSENLKLPFETLICRGLIFKRSENSVSKRWNIHISSQWQSSSFWHDVKKSLHLQCLSKKFGFLPLYEVK